jgi:hypothetical protein
MSVDGVVTRDVVAQRKGQVLAIGQALTLRLKALHDGYLTLLHIGTSGRTYLFAPNTHLAPDQAVIKRGEMYRLPGPMLLPGINLVDEGPPGWEHFIAVLSPRSLLDMAWLVQQEDVDGLFYCLHTDAIQEVVRRIRAEPGASMDLISLRVA